MNKQSANEKMEEYMRMVKLLENVEEVLKNPICNKKVYNQIFGKLWTVDKLRYTW